MDKSVPVSMKDGDFFRLEKGSIFYPIVGEDGHLDGTYKFIEYPGIVCIKNQSKFSPHQLLVHHRKLNMWAYVDRSSLKEIGHILVFGNYKKTLVDSRISVVVCPIPGEDKEEFSKVLLPKMSCLISGASCIVVTDDPTDILSVLGAAAGLGKKIFFSYKNLDSFQSDMLAYTCRIEKVSEKLLPEKIRDFLRI
jgi:hypothetical protein